MPKLMMRMRWPLLALALLATAGLSVKIDRERNSAAEPPAVARQRQIWAQQRVPHYRAVVDVRFAELPYAQGREVFTIQDGQVIGMECLSPDSRCGLAHPRGDSDLVDRLFTMAAEGINQEGRTREQCIDVRYHPVYGFPERIDTRRCGLGRLALPTGQVVVEEFTPVEPLATRRPADGSAAARLLAEEACALPCYAGITPGVTTARDAFDQLLRNPHVAQVQMSIEPGFERNLSWRWAGEQAGAQIQFSRGVGGPISSIEPRIAPTLTLGDVIARLGEPSDVVTTDFCASFAPERFFHIELLYRQRGVYIAGVYASEQAPAVGPEMPVNKLILYDPAIAWAQFSYANRPYALNRSAWRGYGDFFGYSGTDPALRCPEPAGP